MDKDRKKHQDMSVEDILKSIRGIIDNNKIDKDDVLELTEVVEEESVVSDKYAAETSAMLKQFSKDVSSAYKDGKRPRTKTIEDFVVEILRPELKNWLDENLPSLVKQLTENEIKKLIPRDDDI